MVTLADPLHDGDATKAAWTTRNAAEAMPGITTPLGWTVWYPPCELALRGAFCDLGGLRRDDVVLPAALDERFVGVFYGRFAGNIDLMRRMGDQMPGSSGAAVEEQYFASARDIPSSRDLTRLPLVVGKLPYSAWRARRRIRELASVTEAWWAASVVPGAVPDGDGTREVLRDAISRLEVIIRAHTIVSMIGQGTFEQVRRLCESIQAEGLEFELTTAQDAVHESALINDLWAVAHGRLAMAEFLARHGFHGPAEGQLAGKSWREDQAPLRALLDAYRAREAPLQSSGATQRAAAETKLFGALGRAGRVRARLVLRLARSYIPLREVGRATFLKAFDVARAMCRQIGCELHADGVIDDAADVFYLTLDEVLATRGGDLRDVVAGRRRTREQYLTLELPDAWIGPPVATPITATDDGDVGSVEGIAGIGVSPGVAEGRAVVVLDPADPDDLADGDILVCRTTDPSWASLFFLVSACVIDIGGAMSHGAIVARELGLPCVINTRVGTRDLRTGDRIRVDGAAGTVTILSR
ncbi:MAG TPA: PEP-utilizing enzyme [Sporichthyaceae bacterium]